VLESEIVAGRQQGFPVSYWRAATYSPVKRATGQSRTGRSNWKTAGSSSLASAAPCAAAGSSPILTAQVVTVCHHKRSISVLIIDDAKQFATTDEPFKSGLGAS